MEKAEIYWIVLFCGAGGTSSGIHLSGKKVKVLACVNHDKNAIKSHELNHPDTYHFTEDIRDFAVVQKIKSLVDEIRLNEPGVVINIWASLECTNFSKAKGGLPRDADSRTLADYLFMYLDAVNPDYLMIENVVEFMSWGPLDKNGKPISKKSGSDYIRWVDQVKSYGYVFDWKELNSANFGAYTSRNRYFAQFAKGSLPICWAEPTHEKNPKNSIDLFSSQPLKKWKPVRDVLELDQEGNSIFNRKKPLVENSLKRIYAGLVKFVANGEDRFIKKYYSGRPEGKVISINGPAGTIKTADGQAIVNCNFLMKYNSTSKKGKHIPPSIDEPCPVVATQNRLGIASINFLHSYYGNGNAHSENEPCPTITTADRFGKVNVQYLMLNYSNGNNIRSIDNPAGTIVGNDKHSIVTAKHFLYNPQYSNKGNSIDNPCPVIIARQDKKPLSLVVCELGSGFAIPVYDDDSETMIKIKEFMAAYGITDIKMRMLFVSEMLKIQGFPSNYKLIGNQTEQKKFIGNSVE